MPRHRRRRSPRRRARLKSDLWTIESGNIPNATTRVVASRDLEDEGRSRHPDHDLEKLAEFRSTTENFKISASVSPR